MHLDKISIEYQLNMDDSITEMESRLQLDLILYFKVEGLSDNWKMTFHKT